MKLVTELPASTLFFKHWNEADEEVGVLIAKAVFRRHADDKFRAEAAPEIIFEETFDGDPAWSPLIEDQDIAPCKVGTDLLVNATARAPDGGAWTDWPVSVAIPDRLFYEFRVQGPSYWTHRMLVGWTRSAPELVSEVPLSYALAYGGCAPGPNDAEAVHEFNPSGIGFITRERLGQKANIPIPQIGSLDEFMVSDPSAHMTVHGLGPIAKAWLPRRSEAGTFDDAWQRDRHPRMPKDYSVQFWNAAPGPLRVEPPLKGGEQISVSGISHRSEPVNVNLPRVSCAVDLQGAEPAHAVMTLDTVTLDLQSEDQERHTATLIWRIQIAAPHKYDTGKVISIGLEA